MSLEALGGIAVGLVVVLYIGRILFRDKIQLLARSKQSPAKKADSVLKKDFSSKFARCTFYALNDYANGYSQSEWLDYYKERTRNNTLDKNSQEYVEAVAPLVNAVVVGADKFLVRRGMENLERSLQRFMPGVNDRISLNYFVEPYKYVHNEKLAAKSLAEEQLRREAYERERPIREAREAERKAAQQERQQRNRELDAAYARCRGCANSLKCRDSAKRVPGACGGYIPR